MTKEKGTKIQIKEENDPDFGTVLRVFIDGKQQHPFVLKKEPNANEVLLKAVICNLNSTVKVLAKTCNEYNEVRHVLRNLVR